MNLGTTIYIIQQYKQNSSSSCIRTTWGREVLSKMDSLSHYFFLTQSVFKPLTLTPKFIDTNLDALGSAAGLNVKSSSLLHQPKSVLEKQTALPPLVQCFSFVRSAPVCWCTHTGTCRSAPSPPLHPEWWQVSVASRSVGNPPPAPWSYWHLAADGSPYSTRHPL